MRLRGNLGPRSIRAFLFRYQLARLLLIKLEIQYQPEPPARELAEQVLTARAGKREQLHRHLALVIQEWKAQKACRAGFVRIC